MTLNDTPQCEQEHVALDAYGAPRESNGRALGITERMLWLRANKPGVWRRMVASYQLREQSQNDPLN